MPEPGERATFNDREVQVIEVAGERTRIKGASGNVYDVPTFELNGRVNGLSYLDARALLSMVRDGMINVTMLSDLGTLEKLDRLKDGEDPAWYWLNLALSNVGGLLRVIDGRMPRSDEETDIEGAQQFLVAFGRSAIPVAREPETFIHNQVIGYLRGRAARTVTFDAPDVYEAAAKLLEEEGP